MSYQVSGELSFVAVGQWCLDRQYYAVCDDCYWQDDSRHFHQCNSILVSSPTTWTKKIIEAKVKSRKSERLERICRSP